jgi:flagellin
LETAKFAFASGLSDTEKDAFKDAAEALSGDVSMTIAINNGTPSATFSGVPSGYTLTANGAIDTLTVKKGETTIGTIALTYGTAAAGTATFSLKATDVLTLQIGDTADSYNQMTVEVGDIHTSELGRTSLKLDDIDISKQGDAQSAMDSIKAAINTVSDIRGGLGAIQNRLEHTINNLSVMQENIQDAESTIRDTDVADEMMKYTKNSILVQSAQAMLAQANQQPQGVLQLLQ